MVLGPYFQSAGAVNISNLDTGAMTQINGNIINTSIDYSSTMASELSFDVIDFDLMMYKRGYFDIGRDVVYTTETALDFSSFEGDEATGFNTIKRNINLFFEIANVTISDGPGFAPVIQVKCYSKAVQQMKRDRNPGKIGGSGVSFVKKAAKQYGLKCFAENKIQKAQKIQKASGDNQAESLWDVLSNLASENKFLLFEADGILFFASEKYLLNKWGTSKNTVPVKPKKKGDPTKKIERFIPIVNQYKTVGVITTNEDTSSFEVIGRPTINKSWNNPRDSEGSLKLARHNATRIRPGMTIKLIGFSDRAGYMDFDGSYLVDSVSFSNTSPDPVSITFKKPEIKPKDIKELLIGSRFVMRQAFSDGTLINLKLGKNSKAIRPKSTSSIAMKIAAYSVDELPGNGIWDDPRTLPLPTINRRYLYPRYDDIKLLKNGATAQSPIDMYSFPLIYSNGRMSISSYVGIINNVTEQGFNGNQPYSAVVLLTEQNTNTCEPTVIPLATASSSYIAAASSSVSSASLQFIAKMADEASAIEYVQLLRWQQGQVVGSRFNLSDSENVPIPTCSIYPLPTTSTAASVRYPYMGTGLLSIGNIQLYNRPTKIVNGRFESLLPEVYALSTDGFQSNDIYYLILCRIWSDGTTPSAYTVEQAYAKYLNDGLHLGKCSSLYYANMYCRLLLEQQSVILANRFPSGTYTETA